MNKHKYNLSFLLALVLLATLCSFSFAGNFEIINLKHRPANEIIPIIEPLVSDEGRITGDQYVLFIETDAANLEQIKQVIATLDTKIHQLKLSVLYADKKTLARMQANLNVDVQIGDSKKIQADGKIISTNRNKDIENIHTVMVTEGLWADLQTGFNVPVRTRISNPNGTVTENYTYHQVKAGFKIQPQLNGNNIKLNITTKQARRSTEYAGQIETYEVSTTVSGKLNQWIALGGIANETASQQSGISFSTSRQEQNKHQVYVKVELVK